MISDAIFAVRQRMERVRVEMSVLRWMSGVTNLDRIRNEIIRGIAKVGEISKKVQESSLKW